MPPAPSLPPRSFPHFLAQLTPPIFPRLSPCPYLARPLADPLTRFSLQISTAPFACSSPATTSAGRPTRTVASRRASRSLQMTRSTAGRVRRFSLLLCASLTSRSAEYAFGVSELLLHRFKDWPTKGPFTKMAKRAYPSPSRPLSSFSRPHGHKRGREVRTDLSLPFRFLLGVEPSHPLQVLIVGLHDVLLRYQCRLPSVRLPPFLIQAAPS